MGPMCRHGNYPGACNFCDGEGRIRCTYCGRQHDPLTSLSDECLAALPRITNEMIEAALKRGLRDRAIAENDCTRLCDICHRQFLHCECDYSSSRSSDKK